MFHSGPNLTIGSRPALSLSLILHELATNALKHGALSEPDGRVTVSWSVAGANHDRFWFEWKETGGPAVARPTEDGVGNRLIRAGLNGAADSRIETFYEPDGLRLTISADIAGFQQEH